MQFYSICSICYVMVPGKGRFCIKQVLFFGGDTQQPAVRTAVVWSSNFAICKALIGRMAGVSSPHWLFTVMWQPCLCKLSDWLTFTTVKCSSYKNVELASHVGVPIRKGFAEFRHGYFWCQTAHLGLPVSIWHHATLRFWQVQRVLFGSFQSNKGFIVGSKCVSLPSVRVRVSRYLLKQMLQKDSIQNPANGHWWFQWHPCENSGLNLQINFMGRATGRTLHVPTARKMPISSGRIVQHGCVWLVKAPFVFVAQNHLDLVVLNVKLGSTTIEQKQ